MICDRRTFFVDSVRTRARHADGKRRCSGCERSNPHRRHRHRRQSAQPHDPLKKLPGNEMTAICDVYEPRLLQAAEIAGASALKVADYRRILDNREIDAVVIGTPDHWHKTITLDAIAAGKDVYVEKPVSHSIAEGVELVKAIEASKQIVQTGTQQRSWEHWVLGKQLDRLRQARSDHVRPDLLVSARPRRQLRAGLAGQARLEALARIGTRSAVSSGTLLSVAPFLGLRRRLPDRPDDALDRRRPLVHGRGGAALRGDDRAQLQHQALGGAGHRQHDARVSKELHGGVPRAPTSAASTTEGSSSGEIGAR